jgi:hypothetical protein
MKRKTHHWWSEPVDLDSDYAEATRWATENGWKEQSGMWTKPYDAVPGLLSITYSEPEAEE